jgi:signal transduction histidine kinase/AmiR/NasT family two-component response regulator
MDYSAPGIVFEVFGQDRNLRRAAIVATIGLPLLIAAIVLVLGVQWSQSRQIGESVNATYETRLELQQVFSLLQDAETGQRGFMLTGEPSYLAPYEAATGQLQAHWNTLAGRLAADPAQRERLRRLQSLSADKLAELRYTIALRREGQAAKGLAHISGGRGKHLMNRMRGEVAAMETAAAEQSDAALRREHRLTTENGIFLSILSLGLVLLLSAAALLLARGLRAIRLEKDQANQANRAKSSFLAMMSHELRTPMNGVLGMAHVLNRTPLNAEQQKCLDIIKTSGTGLLVVLNDILDLSKIEAEQVELESVAFDLIGVIVQSADLWRNAAADKGVLLNLEGFDAEDPLYVFGDSARVRQILLNLLSNAVKFTERGRITLTLEAPSADSQAFHIAVRDTGPGMSDEVCSRLFQPFVQEDASTTRRFGGTGLGLAISRRLARLMGGDLTVVSRKGEGTTFLLSAPTTLAAPPEAGAERQDIECPAGLSVLVAEDNPQNQMVVRAFLGAIGADATIVDNGQQAVDATRIAHFDIIMLDIHMPVMGGEDAIRAIRAGNGPCATAPIIALTADAMAGDRERYITLGFNDHIAKPIEPERFVSVLARWATASVADDAIEQRTAMG